MADRSDAELLTDLLSRERRLVSAYEAALRRDAIEASLGETLLAHERAHVAALERTLAGRGDEIVGIYTDRVPRIRDPKLRQPLGSIMTCEAAHVVALEDSLSDRFLVN